LAFGLVFSIFSLPESKAFFIMGLEFRASRDPAWLRRVVTDTSENLMKWPRLRLFPIAALLLLTPFLSSLSRAEPPSGPPAEFEKHILPILQSRCVKCHGAEKRKADLDVRSKGSLLRGGESGPALVPGASAKSFLWEKIAADKMPPGKDKLTAAEKALVRRWIDGGALARQVVVDKKTNDADDRQVTDADRRFWAFQKPIRPSIPGVKHKDRVHNPIDTFILEALEKKGLALSSEADRVTLLRRAYFDLVGLPPSPEEIDAFLADKRGDAYERLIDRLLSSAHYGERWGRHWLDLAGYADSEGILDADYVRSAAWRYRDYVIRVFNSDKPYDRFLQEQLAGDELTDYWTAYRGEKSLSPEVVEAVVATGYLRCASDTSRPDFVNIKNAPGYYYQTLDDTVKIIGSSLMGLTVHCAKCHSHKYDPIPQTDYYRLQAVFMSGYRPKQWVPQVERRLFEATAHQEKEAKEQNAKIDAAIAGLRKQVQALRQQYGERLFQDRLAKLPVVIREDVRTALIVAPAKRSEVQKYLATKFQSELRPPAPELDRLLPTAYPEYRSKVQDLEKAIKAHEGQRRRFTEIRAFYDLPGEAITPLLRRGDYLQPGREMKPGTLAVLATPQAFFLPGRSKEARSSGRRLAFARWLTQPEHPLTARVLVNRLWLHHFGSGIVATPANFGHTGASPSHPQLLDWLATEFIARGWSIKAMHRLIMTSSVYRQASRLDPGSHALARKIDPDNRLLWRQRLRRLEAEALRDAALSVAGSLNREMFGPPVPMQRQGDGEVVVPAGPAGERRSVYLQIRRSQPLTFLQVFDQPVLETNCTRRETSTVASQALTLLNSEFMVRQAESFAGRVLRENPADVVGHAVRIAFGRDVSDRERKTMDGFLAAQASRHARAAGGNETEGRRRALADLCHMLMSANEFAYVD
jgi:hypothetical protein